MILKILKNFWNNLNESKLSISKVTIVKASAIAVETEGMVTDLNSFIEYGKTLPDEISNVPIILCGTEPYYIHYITPILSGVSYDNAISNIIDKLNKHKIMYVMLLRTKDNVVLFNEYRIS